MIYVKQQFVKKEKYLRFSQILFEVFSNFIYLCTRKLINNSQTTKNMERNYSRDKTPIRATLKKMEVGESVHFPVSRTSVVRSTSSTLNLELGRKYVSRLNRDTMVIDVTRIS